MSSRANNTSSPIHCSCCPSSPAGGRRGFSRRGFLGGLGGAALGATALKGLSWSALAADAPKPPAPERTPLVVKPVFIYSVFQPHPQTSWRAWGGIQTQKDADEEKPRIQAELEKMRAAADFPVKFLPLSSIQRGADVKNIPDVKDADAVLVYAAAGDGLEPFGELGKDVIFFVRWKSGPVYLWYEIISPRYLRQHTDRLSVKKIDFDDVVVDSLDEVVWRLRALCGLKNTVGSRIIAIGGPGGWASPKAPELAVDRFKLDIRTVDYGELSKLLQAAHADAAAVARSRGKAAEYLKDPGVSLETKKEFVENAFLLEEVFLSLMARESAKALTVNSCMGTIMPMSQTTACLTLSTLNDAGYAAYCESDFVVIPSGILLTAISGKPMFLNDPTYPAGGIITLAHCTAPRKMDGKNLEPVRLVTHFESDYGASPKVEMHNGQKVTNIIPDFLFERWVGLGGEIVDHPFLPICRSQIDIQFKADSRAVAEKMPGFHWMTIYGDYLREAGYALKKTKIAWECLG